MPIIKHCFASSGVCNTGNMSRSALPRKRAASFRALKRPNRAPPARDRAASDAPRGAEVRSSRRHRQATTPPLPREMSPNRAKDRATYLQRVVDYAHEDFMAQRRARDGALGCLRLTGQRLRRKVWGLMTLKDRRGRGGYLRDHRQRGG